MRFGVIVFPGSNCDQDCFYVIKDILNQPVEYIWHKDIRLNDFDCIILPGGFSYGDYLRTGAIARFSPIMKQVSRFAQRGGLVIGICNGFQILLETGLLPGAMLRNKNLHFICKYVYVKTENNKTPFTNLCSRNQILKIPIAHNEGNYYIDKSGLKKLEKNRQIIFRYCSQDGNVNKESNPNGTLANIGGIVNKEGNILGMMPHPERSSEEILGSEEGLLIFKSIAKWLKNKR
ncbi:MAG: phosphoribosylformylglycinamidine synthase subunit PurQ [Candidatus Omnitrophica bacterium]|nr:phosphoribosylformylglycinamidine synthase subunit PurQ [Candidatus Omnitrophota bacterium]